MSNGSTPDMLDARHALRGVILHVKARRMELSHVYLQCERSHLHRMIALPPPRKILRPVYSVFQAQFQYPPSAFALPLPRLSRRWQGRFRSVWEKAQGTTEAIVNGLKDDGWTLNMKDQHRGQQ